MKVITKRLGMPSLDLYASEYTARPFRKAFVALSPEQRTAATQALGATVKALILSDSFRTAWAAEVKQRGGVNHGISVADESAMPDAAQSMDAAKKAIIAGRIKEAEEFARQEPLPASTLQTFLQIEPSLIEGEDNMLVASPGAQKAALAKYAEAKKLLATNPAAAQKAMLDAKLLAVGLPAGSSGLAEAKARTGAQAVSDEKQRQQASWNKLQLVPLVKDVLDGLVKTAATVDFAAATQAKDKKVVFVNPAYERKPYDWKLLYRAGKGPTMVAVTLAKQVLAELK